MSLSLATRGVLHGSESLATRGVIWRWGGRGILYPVVVFVKTAITRAFTIINPQRIFRHVGL